MSANELIANSGVAHGGTMAEAAFRALLRRFASTVGTMPREFSGHQNETMALSALATAQRKRTLRPPTPVSAVVLCSESLSAEIADIGWFEVCAQTSSNRYPRYSSPILG